MNSTKLELKSLQPGKESLKLKKKKKKKTQTLPIRKIKIKSNLRDDN